VFNRTRKPELHALDSNIASLILEIEKEESGTEKHTTMVASLRTLMELRNADKALVGANRISPDAIAAVAGNLLSIGLILGFEKAHVLTSKSLSFVPKAKI
jgi:hypothetical protein